MRKKCYVSGEIEICDYNKKETFKKKESIQTKVVSNKIHIKDYATLKEIGEKFRDSFSNKGWAILQDYIRSKVHQVPRYVGNTSIPYLTQKETENLVYIGEYKNRALDAKRIKNIIKRMSRDGYITLPELVKSVDGRMLVGDGQHKCLAYYILGYKIPKVYVCESSLNMSLSEMVTRINSGMKNWPVEDYEKKYKKHGCMCTITKDILEDMKPNRYPTNCLYMFITGKKIHSVGDFVKRSIEERESLMRMSPQDLENDFQIFVDCCLKRLVKIFGCESYHMFGGFTKFAVENGLENITYTGFLNYLENLDKKFSTITGPSDGGEWQNYFIDMYNKYNLNKK